MDLLLVCSIRAVLMAAAVATVLGVLRIANPAARHRAWCGVLAGMLLLPAASLWLPKTTIRVLPAVSGTLADAPWSALPPETAPAPLPATEHRSTPIQNPQEPDLLLAVYLCGVVILLARLLLGTARAAWLVKSASQEAEFYARAECICPITVGWLRPVIVLPTAWSEWPRAELEAVLRHEREHVRRRDPLVQWIAALNRCVFWFHPLAWWLERRLAHLAEEACDAAVIAGGHDPHDYSEYLLHQARAIEQAGTRVALLGSAMGRGSLAKRIDRLLDRPPAPALSRAKAATVAAVSTTAVFIFAACSLGRVEKPAPGQPTMNELMHRHAATTQQEQEKAKAMLERARALTPDEAQSLVAHLKTNPDDPETYWTLVRHYEYKVDVAGLDALRLWFIEHRPGGKFPPGNINPRYDRAAYERGKALWLAHLKRPGASIEIYRRAADYLEGGDRPLAESALQAGQQAYPNNPEWPHAFGRHYAQALLGSGEPMTEYNVFRVATAQEAQGPYAKSVRTRLAQSTDPEVLASTAQGLLAWNGHFTRDANDSIREAMELARTYIDRALSVQPDSRAAKAAQRQLTGLERWRRAAELSKLPPSDLAKISDSDRILLTLTLMQREWPQKPDESAAKARELLALIACHLTDPLYGDAIFDANITLGKWELRHGKRAAATRHLLAAAETPGLNGSHIEMNLPRALVDWGERRGVADFLDRMAPKAARSQQYREWAADIRKGINPDLLPTFSFPGCSQGPC